MCPPPFLFPSLVNWKDKVFLFWFTLSFSFLQPLSQVFFPGKGLFGIGEAHTGHLAFINKFISGQKVQSWIRAHLKKKKRKKQKQTSDSTPAIGNKTESILDPPMPSWFSFTLFYFRRGWRGCCFSAQRREEPFLLFPPSLYFKNLFDLDCKQNRLTGEKSTVALNSGVCIFSLYLSPLLIIVLFSEQICHIHGDRAGLLSFWSNSSHK